MFAQLSSVMVSGDSGLLSGVFSGEVLTLVDFANITLGTVGGQPSPFLYGGIAVSAAWTLVAGTTYKRNLSTGLTVYGCNYKWIANVDASGRHYGWLKPQVNAANVQTTANSWYYDSVTTGDLTVNVGEDPGATGDIRYCQSVSYGGIYIENGTNVTIDGIEC